ncbi:MAG: hypothetical protein K2P68_02715 [Sphingomonas sp.]|nr:hypothetical protein [Sphingomonas sp.]
MSRKKDKAAKAAATPGKTGRVKLPKKIGTVKLPKELRKSGERLIETGIEALRDAATREIATAGIAAIVANAVRSKDRHAQTTAGQGPRPSARTVEAVIIDDEPPRPAFEADAMINAVGAAAIQALQKLMAKPTS